MLRGLAESALVAGAVAAFALTVFEAVLVDPLIAHAEMIEAERSIDSFVPAVDWPRLGLTLVSNLVTVCGFGFVMAGMMVLLDGRLNGAAVPTLSLGLLWGGAGFLCVTLAPSLGLPPEPPGVASVDLAARQAWWVACVAASVLGVALIAATRRYALWAAAVVLLALPHLIGAPEVPRESAPASLPPALAAAFSARAIAAGFVTWIVLGLVLAPMARRTGIIARRGTDRA